MKIRKVISCILMTAVVVTSTNTLSSTRTLAAHNTINVVKDNNGQFVDSKDSKNSIKAQLIQGEVYSLDNGTLLLQTSEDVYQIVQRHTAKLSDSDKVNLILNDASIPQEVKEDVLKKSQQAIETNSKLATVDVYIPDISNASSRISPMTTTNTFYTYNNKKLKDTVVYYTNFQSGNIVYVKGFNAGNLASSIKEFIIMGAETNKYVSIFTTAVSVLQNFFNVFGAKTYYGSAQDYASFNVCYDITTKWTFVDLYGDGSWATGAVTEKVLLKNIRYEEYFVTNKGGNYRNKIEYYNKTYITPNFNNPAPKAVQWAGGAGWVDDKIRIKIGTTVFVY